MKFPGTTVAVKAIWAVSCLGLMGAAAFNNADAQSCKKRSLAYTVALLELYTSEGCDSCPPAEKFISGFRAIPVNADAMTADEVVPLSFHVDYWDDLGWRDVFAKNAFTLRQRWLSGLASSRTVYTPEFFLQGKESRAWLHQISAAVKFINTKPAQADIDIATGRVIDGRLQVNVNASAMQNGKLYVVLYENAIRSDVGAGENSGVTLLHDYTVRDWAEQKLSPDYHGHNTTYLSYNFVVPASLTIKNLGVAAFVQTDRGEVLQALALPLCGS